MARVVAVLTALAAVVLALPAAASAATAITVLTTSPDPARAGEPVVAHVEGVVDGRTTSLVVVPTNGPGDAVSMPVGPGAFAADLTLTGLDRRVFGIRATLQGDDTVEDVERELLLQWDFSDLIGIVRARPVWFGLAVTVEAPPALGGPVFLEVDGRPCNSDEEMRREGTVTIYSCALRGTQKVVHISARRDVSEADGGQAFTPPVTVDRTAEAEGLRRVTIDRGIGSLWLGTSRRDVEGLIGTSGSFAFGPFRALRAGPQLLVRYDRAGRVKFVATAPVTSGPYTTPKGVTQNASAARLRRAHPNAHCVATAVPITFPDRLIRGQNCYFGAKAAQGGRGHPATWLSTVHGLELFAVGR